ncbi:MAG: SIMPL domain-containing protein [Anaerolineaceae bacterium]|nr:SIMPL domain-containing protein [Anaerolineaceae bacterium]
MKKIYGLLIALFLMVMTSAATAETKITVNGSGEIRVSADTAVISLGVSARDKDVLKAQQKVNGAITNIRKALIEKGVKEENLNTEYINIYAMYDYQNDREQLAAYDASSTLAIKVTDIENVGAYIDAAFASGANTLNGINFSASDTKEAKNEAMKEAVADAKMKAEVLAQASGLKITGIELISESGVYSYENNIGNVYAKELDTAEAASGAGTVVQAAKLIVNATVSITFTAE